MVGTTNNVNEKMDPFGMRDDALRQQLESVIDHELHELGFANLCKKIAFKVVEKVQKIDKDHDEIKRIYGDLGTRLANLLVESDSESQTDNITSASPTSRGYADGTSGEKRRNSNDANVKCVIVIDDDDEAAVDNAGSASPHTVSVPDKIVTVTVTEESNCSEFCVSSHSNSSPCTLMISDKTCTLPKSSTVAESSNTASLSSQIIIDSEPDTSNDPAHHDAAVQIHKGDESIVKEKSAVINATQDINTNNDDGETIMAIPNSLEIEVDKTNASDNIPNSEISRLPPLLSEDIEMFEDTQVSSLICDENITDKENHVAPPSPSTTGSQLSVTDTDSQSSGILPDLSLEPSRSPLILKIQKETPVSSESTSYSSTMISHKDKNFEREIMAANCNSNTAKKKPFIFVERAIIYAKPCGSDIWYEAELLKEILGMNNKQTKYQVRFMGGQRLQQKILLKSMATKDSANIEEVKLGTRIVAGRPSDTVNTTISKKYKDISSGNNINVMFAGVVAELACEANRYRYLVFFDDGYAQYFNLSSLYLVAKPSYHVWNDVAEDCQEFIKEYLQEYPYRPLVCTNINSTMQTEWNGEWWKSKVVSIDASLVKILFDVDKRSEWIYRGTTRLEPLYNHFTEKKPQKKKKKTGKTKDDTYVDEKITHPQFGVCKYSLKDAEGNIQRKEWNLPDVTFKRSSSGKANSVLDLNKFSTTDDDDDDDDDDDIEEEDRIMPKKLRIEAGIEPVKSDNGREPSTISSQEAFGVVGALQMSPTNIVLPATPQVSSSAPKKDEISENAEQAKSIPAAPSKPVIPKPVSPEKRGPHTCNPSCIKDRKKLIDEHRHGIFNYLSIPFKLGWKRESSKKKTGWHRDIYYRTPCNRRLRNLLEVTTYLLLTKCSNVCIDMFCFQASVSCRNQPLKPRPPIAKIDDLSGGKETCPIVCVNEINDELPNPIVYISNRLKAEDVSINTDPGFLVCCDCVDNCQDKSKCGCAQLTIESSNAIDDIVNSNAGYQYRRLKETMTTGIYECNQNCSCNRETCYNRVVQNGIQLRLQVFMTENRGWGLRCVDDIPKGTFICTYTGQVLNEQTANREGMDFGDEYLAELDHIEVVEKAKDDYESDVPELRENISISSDSDSDSDSSVLSISSDSDNSDTEENGKKQKLAEDSPEVKDTPFATIDSAPNSNSTDSSSDISEPIKEKSVIPCHVPIQRIPSVDWPVHMDSPSGESMSEDQLPGSPNIDFSLSSPAHIIPNSETKPVSNDTVDKLPNISDKPTSDITTLAVGSDHTTFSGKAVAIKSTANKAYAHKSTGGKRLEKSPTSGRSEVSPKKSESNAISTRSLYDGDKQMYVIDAKCFGNVGRFMNHCCSPNLFVQNVMVDTHDLRFPWVAFFSGQNIQAYSELTWDYNYEIGSVPGKTMLCKCGAKNCKGRLL